MLPWKLEARDVRPACPRLQQPHCRWLDVRVICRWLPSCEPDEELNSVRSTIYSGAGAARCLALVDHPQMENVP